MSVDPPIENENLDKIIPHDLVRYDDNGYPTDEALSILYSFYGTPRQLVAYLKSLWRPSDAVTVRFAEDSESFHRDHPEVEIVFTTIGWSGNESVISALEYTVFSFLYWYLSKRGGRHVYRVYAERWDSMMFLGDYRNLSDEKGPIP